MGMEYPMNVMHFEKEFGTEESCQKYLFNLKFKEGFVCESCGCNEYWITKEYVYICRDCRKHIHLKAGTIFQDSQKPLSLWFRAIWWVTTQKN